MCSNGTELKTLAAPYSSTTRLRNTLLLDGLSSKVIFSFSIKEITQASKLAVPWQSVAQILRGRKKGLKFSLSGSLLGFPF